MLKKKFFKKKIIPQTKVLGSGRIVSSAGSNDGIWPMRQSHVSCLLQRFQSNMGFLECFANFGRASTAASLGHTRKAPYTKVRHSRSNRSEKRKRKGHAPSKDCLHCHRHPSLSLSLALSCSSSYSLHLHWSYVFNCFPSSNILIFPIRPILLTHLSILGYPNLFVPFVF